MAHLPPDQPGERLRRPAALRSLHLGDTTVTFVPDGDVRLPPLGWLPDTTADIWAAHPHYLDASDHLVASIGGLLIERGERALLIDAGFGPQSLPPDPATPRGAIRGGALLDHLVALGRDPRSLEAVAFTHLHADHFGWASYTAPGERAPVFAPTPYIVSEPEWGDIQELAARGVSAEVAAALTPQVRTVSDGEEIFPGVHVRVSSGHTPGHAEYVITAGRQRLIAFGDALHSPIQIAHPEWSAAVDHDPARATADRRRLIAELSEAGTIGYGNHFADVVFGEVRVDSSGPAWFPVDD